MFLMCIHQLALANQEAKSFCWCLWKQGAAYCSEAKITVISRADSQKEYPECLFINWLGSLVIDGPNHGPGVDVEQGAAGAGFAMTVAHAQRVGSFLAAMHASGNGPGVSSWNKRQFSQDV